MCLRDICGRRFPVKSSPANALDWCFLKDTYCQQPGVLDERGDVVFEHKLSTTPKALRVAGLQAGCDKLPVITRSRRNTKGDRL